ncbi:MAG: 50S ribosomal protein L18 [Parcubacteria group bacterium]|nr:50S ribosomal protein L18 [Parcubacteria group bacterium]
MKTKRNPSTRREKRERRHRRVRGKVHGTLKIPRLVVFRSNRHLYASLIDDQKQNVLASCSDRDMATKTKKKPQEIAKEIGNDIAKKAKAKKVVKVVFDRGGYKYHGLVKALAEGAREGGLIF